MQKLNDFKKYIHGYYTKYVPKDDPNETWEDYWEILFEALREEGAIIVRNGQKFVKDIAELKK